MVRFGKYDQRILILNFGSTSDGYGGTVPSYTIVLNTYASVMQLKGGNDIEAAQLELPQTYKMKILIRAGFTLGVEHRIAYRGFVHQIQGIEISNERYRREYIVTVVKTDESYDESSQSGIGAWQVGSTLIVS